MYSEKFKTFIEIWEKKFGIARTIDEETCVDREGGPIPWYTYPSIEYLDQFDYTGKKIFEFGCGNSSKYWAARAGKVTSVEDNPQWFAKWQRELTAPNQQVLLRREDETYENAVLESDIQYDVIIIDGKRRARCCQTALQRLAPGGLVILDDSDRANTAEEYRQAIALLRAAGLLQVDFYGFCPINSYPKATTLFFCRDFNFKSRFAVQPANGIGNLWGMGRRARKEFIKKQNSPDAGQPE